MKDAPSACVGVCKADPEPSTQASRGRAERVSRFGTGGEVCLRFVRWYNVAADISRS